MSSLPDWCKLHARWYDDDVLNAAADRAPVAFVLWPILVAMAKSCSHYERNPTGSISVTPRQLAFHARCSESDLTAALDAMSDGDLVKWSIEMGTLCIEVCNFAKWQTPRRSKAEREANHRWRKHREAASREKAATRDGGAMVAGRSRDGRAMPDGDGERDGERDSPSNAVAVRAHEPARAHEGAAATTAEVCIDALLSVAHIDRNTVEDYVTRMLHDEDELNTASFRRACAAAASKVTPSTPWPRVVSFVSEAWKRERPTAGERKAQREVRPEPRLGWL